MRTQSWLGSRISATVWLGATMSPGRRPNDCTVPEILAGLENLRHRLVRRHDVAGPKTKRLHGPGDRRANDRLLSLLGERGQPLFLLCDLCSGDVDVFFPRALA